jgi:hypothetical protein
MARRPRDIGTEAETAVTRFLQDCGLQADRTGPHGANDIGDVQADPWRTIIFEVKAGKAAEQASANLIESWMQDTERERKNAGADIGILVVKKKGIGTKRAGQWDAYMRVGDLFGLVASDAEGRKYAWSAAPNFTVRTALDVLMEDMREYLAVRNYGRS